MEVYEALEKALEQNDLKLFQSIYFNVDNEKFKYEFSWDLVLLCITYLDKLSNQNQTEPINFLKRINKQLCECYANPKEIYLVYLENCDFFLKIENFDHFIDLILTIFQKTSLKFVNSSLHSVLGLFNEYIAQFPSGKCQEHIEIILVFFNSLVDKFNNSIQLTETITKFLIEWFKHIFKKDLIDTKDPSPIEKTVFFINKINKNLFSLINKFESLEIKNKKNIEVVDQTALSLFTSYILIKQSKVDYDYLNFPKVYKDIFIFDTFLDIITRLFNDINNEIFICYGLLATKFLIEKIEKKTLSEDYFEFGPMIKLIESLFRTSVYSQSEANRKISNQLLKTGFCLFTRSSRFYFVKYFYSFYSKASESMSIYVLSYLMYLLKEEINESINLNEDFYFLEKFNLKKIFFPILVEKKIDVVKESSLVISVLSIIRLILLKDKTNRTGIYLQLKNLVTNYLDGVELNCKDSQKFYSTELTNLISKNEKIDDIKKTITINQEVTSQPTKTEQIQSIEATFQTINLIESLIFRVKELYEENKNK